MSLFFFLTENDKDLFGRRVKSSNKQGCWRRNPDQSFRCRAVENVVRVHGIQLEENEKNIKQRINMKFSLNVNKTTLFYDENRAKSISVVQVVQGRTR